MVTTHPAARVGIFIDVQNIYHSAKNLHGSRVNFRELIRSAVGNRSLARALAYVVKSEGIVPENEVHGEAAFFDALRDAGLELRQKDLQVYAGGSKKADWDVGLAVDAIRLASSIDVVILVTGDGDFVPLVEYLKQGMGRQVEVVAFGRATSGKLREVADRFLDLDTHPKLLLKIRQAEPRPSSGNTARPPGPKSPPRARSGRRFGRGFAARNH
jgi:uncharacterized LabA/DUF88 family protein